MQPSAAAWVCTPWPLTHVAAATEVWCWCSSTQLRKKFIRHCWNCITGSTNGSVVSPDIKHRSRLLGKVEKTLLFLARPGWLLSCGVTFLRVLQNPPFSAMGCNVLILCHNSTAVGRPFYLGNVTGLGLFVLWGFFLSNHVA